jgi:glucose/arabinose dehydrogenase
MRTVLTALLALAPFLAGAAEIRTGADAYGDWRTDAPGVARRITPADLPQPFATRSSARMAGIVERPAGAAPVAPPGFAVTLWASGLRQPRVLRTAPDGSVFLAESGAGRVLRFTPDGHRTTFAEDLNRPYGIAFWPPAAPRYVYVGETNRVVRFPWSPGEAAPGGAAETIVPALPTGGHWTRDLAAAPDGSALFVAVGSGSNLVELRDDPPGGLAAWDAAHGLGAAWDDEQGRAAVLRLDPAGGTLQPYAQGVRNCSGLGVQPGSGRLWCATNERDGLGDDLPPDYVTHLTPGAFYGWPWFYIGGHADPRLGSARADLASRVTVPDVLLQPHSAPLGIAFYTGTLFPPEYRGDAFVTLHGSWNRAKRTGYKVVRLKLASGQADGTYEDFLTGFVVSDDAVWGRPVGITMAADGALLVSEDAGGTIWRVTPAR